MMEHRGIGTRSGGFLARRSRSSARVLAMGGLLSLGACVDDGEPLTPAPGSTTDAEASTGSGTTTQGPGEDSSSGSSSGSTSSADESSADASSTGEPGETLLERVATAMGGAEVLLELGTLRIESTGESQIIEEGYLPGASFITTTFMETASFDLAQNALRIDIDRSVGTFGVPTPQTLSEIVLAEEGWIDGVESLFGLPSGPMPPDRLASERRQQRLLNPHLMIREALADPSLASEGPTELGLAQLVIDDAVHPVVLWIDEATDLPVRATTLENDHVYRDVELEITYEGWAETGAGPWFPMEVVLSVHDQISRAETRTSIEVEPRLPIDAFVLPGEPLAWSADDAARGARNHHFHQVWANAGLPRDGLDLDIVPVAVPGHDAVTLLTGPSAYNSLVIEREAGVVVVEAPLYAPRCEAILEWIDAEIGKPVEAVIITHHHYDHSACARTFVGAGATLVASQAAGEFWDEVLAAPSAVEPDRLAESGVEPTLQTVTGSFELGGDPLSVQVFEVASEHAADITMVLADGVLFTSDLYSPGFTLLLPYGPSDLLAAVELFGVGAQVDAITGGHGAEVHTLAQLQAAAP